MEIEINSYLLSLSCLVLYQIYIFMGRALPGFHNFFQHILHLVCNRRKIISRKIHVILTVNLEFIKEKVCLRIKWKKR